MGFQISRRQTRICIRVDGGRNMKTVAVSDDVYKILIRIKYEKNFKNVSEVIDYLIKRNNNAGR